MSFLSIINPGFLTTIQDRGRFNYQKWGVPVSGAMDEYALRVANILVGNDEHEASLEITILGPAIKFLASGVVALTGADLGASLNERSCKPWESYRVSKGDILQFAGAVSGCRAYLAAAGGFDIPDVMGSKSTYLRGRIGGLDGRALREGDELGVKPQVNGWIPKARVVPAEYRKKLTTPMVARVVLGPQDDAFTPEGIETFLLSEYKFTLETDRMGCRLEGPVIKHKHKPDIISDGIAPGSIQVPGKGTPIILMADRQTTGGYAKIATIITPDLWQIAQAKPGDRIRFNKITPTQAYEAYLEYESILSMLPDKLITKTNKE